MKGVFCELRTEWLYRQYGQHSRVSTVDGRLGVSILPKVLRPANSTKVSVLSSVLARMLSRLCIALIQLTGGLADGDKDCDQRCPLPRVLFNLPMLQFLSNRCHKKDKRA